MQKSKQVVQQRSGPRRVAAEADHDHWHINWCLKG